ncbi:MAG: hypothetical protein Fur0010_28370 [Bdellovibrio sp.]
MKISNLSELKNNIDHKIEDIEKETDAEVVVSIHEWSDRYPGAHLRLGILFSLLLPTLYYLSPFDYHDEYVYIGLQFFGLILGHSLAYIKFIKKFMATPIELKEEVRQKAIQQYFDFGVAHHPKELGILIFITLGERRLEVIWDQGLKKLGDDRLVAWVKRARSLLKKDGLDQGLISALDELGTLLKELAPQTGGAPENMIKNLEAPEA